MEEYCFFSRLSIWYNADPDIPDVKTYITDKFMIDKKIGSLLLGLTGSQIINRELPNKVISEIIKLYKSVDRLYDILETEDFIKHCVLNKEYYLYPSNMRIIGYWY